MTEKTFTFTDDELTLLDFLIKGGDCTGADVISPATVYAELVEKLDVDGVEVADPIHPDAVDAYDRSMKGIG